MGKTRNAPIREWTIPRLELQAAVPVGQTFFWSDSMTSLQYIKNETRRFQTFVASRVAEINETSSPEQWHHIPGVINTADDGSRGVSAQYFHAACRWWSGPKFLWEPEHSWPNVPLKDLQDYDIEVRKSQTVKVYLICTTDRPLAAALFIVVPFTESNVVGATSREESS